MHKNFDEWNIKKKYISNRGSNKFYKSREIWWCTLGLNIGFEQDGKNELFERPVLVIKGLSGNTCLVAPLSTSIYTNIYRINIGYIRSKETQVILSQLRVVDTKRFTDRIAILDKAIFETIRKTLKDML